MNFENVDPACATSLFLTIPIEVQCKVAAKCMTLRDLRELCSAFPHLNMFMVNKMDELNHEDVFSHLLGKRKFNLNLEDHSNCRLVSKAWKRGVDGYNRALKLDNSIDRPDAGDEKRNIWMAKVEVPLTRANWISLKTYGEHNKGGFIGGRIRLIVRDSFEVFRDKDVVFDATELEDAVLVTKHLWKSVEYLEVCDDGAFQEVECDFEELVAMRKCMLLYQSILRELTNVKQVVLRSIYCAHVVNFLPRLENLEEVVEQFEQDVDENEYPPAVDWKMILAACHPKLTLLHAYNMRISLLGALNRHVFPKLEEYYQKEYFPSYILMDACMPKLKILGVTVFGWNNWNSLSLMTHKLGLLEYIQVESATKASCATAFATAAAANAVIAFTSVGDLEDVVTASVRVKTVVLKGGWLRQCLHVVKEIFPSANVQFQDDDDDESSDEDESDDEEETSDDDTDEADDDDVR